MTSHGPTALRTMPDRMATTDGRLARRRSRRVARGDQQVTDTASVQAATVRFEPEVFEEEQRRAGRATSGPTIIVSPVELHPRPFQQRLLELLEVSRQAGHHRNLLVAATGTGKTVMAALDYAALRQTFPRARLLFVAHREEILDQSMATFRYALRDPTFGEKWVGGRRPERFKNLFASIQSLSASDAATLPPDH